MTCSQNHTGSGTGGVAVAARLAKNGIRVTVLEKNNYTGGRCSIIEDEGYVKHNCSSQDATTFN